MDCAGNAVGADSSVGADSRIGRAFYMQKPCTMGLTECPAWESALAGDSDELLLELFDSAIEVAIFAAHAIDLFDRVHDG